MTRLFILFYMSILAVLAAAWYIHGLISDWQNGDQFQRIVESTHQGGAGLVAQSLNAVPPEQRSEELKRLQQRFDFPLRLQPLNKLPDHAAQRIRDGASTVYYRRNGGVFVAAPLNPPDTAVQLGPFPGFSHYEESLAGGMRLAADQIARADESSRPQVLRRLTREFGYPVQLLPYENLGDYEKYRMQTGHDVVFFVRDNLAYVAAVLPGSDYVAQFGPFANNEDTQRRVFATTLAVVLILAAFAIALLLRPIARQLRTVENAAHALADGRLSARVSEHQTTSVRSLAQAFNEMASRMENLVRTQRQLLQAVSHELRTPLARMRFAIDLIDSAESDSERKQHLTALDTATEELDALVGELLTYVRMETAEQRPARETVALKETVEHIVQTRASLYPQVEFDVQLSDCAENCFLNVEPGALTRAIGNLLSNAGRHADTRVVLRGRCERNSVILDVDDDGPGIPEADRIRVLAPFVRLENSSQGVGLGLALVQRIVVNHGGEVQILQSPEGGCRVRTIWPCAAAADRT